MNIGTREMKLLFALLLTLSTSAYSYDTHEEMAKSAVQLDKLYGQAAEISNHDKKLRVIFDVTGGVRMGLMKLYNPSGGNVTPELQNQYQLTYAYAVLKLALLAETMGLHDAVACHTHESAWLMRAADIDNEDMSGMPKCRRDIYSQADVAKIQSQMLSDPDADLKYNTLAGSLIKQINLNSYYTAKGLREADLN